MAFWAVKRKTPDSWRPLGIAAIWGIAWVARKKSVPGQCFAGHEKFDLLWHGKKIAGAAQRRNRFGLLIQGSIQPPLLSLSRPDWERAMVEVARQDFDAAWKELLPDSKLWNHANQLAREKYSQSTHQRKR